MANAIIRLVFCVEVKNSQAQSASSSQVDSEGYASGIDSISETDVDTEAESETEEEQSDTEKTLKSSAAVQSTSKPTKNLFGRLFSKNEKEEVFKKPVSKPPALQKTKDHPEKFMNVSVVFETAQPEGLKTFNFRFEIPNDQQLKLTDLKQKLLKKAGKVDFSGMEWIFNSGNKIVKKDCSEEIVIDCNATANRFLTIRFQRKNAIFPTSHSSAARHLEGDFGVYFAFYLSKKTQQTTMQAAQQFWLKSDSEYREKCLKEFKEYSLLRELIINRLLQIGQEEKSIDEKKMRRVIS